MLALILLTASVTLVNAQQRTRSKPAAPTAESQADQNRQKAMALFESGQDAHQAGKLEEAVRLYTEALEKDSSLWQAEFQRSSACFSLGKFDDARTSVKRTLELLKPFPDSPELRKITSRANLLQGEIELATSKYNEAETAFRRALEIQPDIAQAHSGIAQIQLEKNQPLEAINEAKAAIAAGDDRAITHSVLGEAQLRVKQYDNAVQSFTAALERDPKNPIFLRFRAESFAAKRDLPNAINDFRASLAIE
ncbi:MAG TPA: tetratricopeptide repeat protein, partial [Blastocatellia bacterium]|nr:tetratricopeptide repeat protein [Blastocatellia bacterium]